MQYLIIILIVALLGLALWINYIYGSAWYYSLLESKSVTETEKRTALIKEALMIFSVSKGIEDLSEKEISHSIYNSKLSLIEIIHGDYWVKFYFYWSKKYLEVVNNSDIDTGKVRSIKLKIKQNKFDSNKLMVFFGLPVSDKEARLKQLCEIAEEKHDAILKGHTKEQILTELVLPHLIDKTDLGDPSEAAVVVGFLATLIDEDEKEEK